MATYLLTSRYAFPRASPPVSSSDGLAGDRYKHDALSPLHPLWKPLYLNQLS